MGTQPFPSQSPVFPLSVGQQRLWFVSQLYPQSTAYNVWFAIRMKGTLDVRVWGRVLNELFERHASLRTVFRYIDGQAMQAIDPAGSVALSFENLEAVPATEREGRLRERIHEEAHRPFDLSAGPPVRIQLFKFGREDHAFVLTTHHLVIDGWSLGIFQRELQSLYCDFVAGRPSSLPALPLRYVDFAQTQRGAQTEVALDRKVASWTKQFAGVPEPRLPTDHARPRIQSLRGASEATTLSTELVDRLQAVGKAAGTTLFMTLLGAFQTFLYRHTNQDEFLLSFPFGGRTQLKTEGLIGFFVNTLVLRSDLSGNPTFRELLVRTRKSCFAAYAHQDVPFEKLVKTLGVERDLSRSPLSQVQFTMTDVPAAELNLPGLSVTPIDLDFQAVQGDLTLFIRPSVGGLRCEFNYSTDLFEQGTARRMLERFVILLESIAADPGARVDSAAILPPSEVERLLVNWNDSAAEYPQDQLLQQLFEEQARKNPDKTAVVFEDEKLTYRELDERSNQLARWLRSQGVTSDQLVAVFMERSLEMVVSLHAILKAGGAYVPVDPEYPAARVSYMLEDSAARIVLTQERRKSQIQGDRRVLAVDAEWAQVEEQSLAALEPVGNPDSLAYVIYTSGSTGQPKGAMNAHRGVVNRLDWMQKAYPLTSADVVLQKTPFSFDVSVWELFWPLLAGARLVMAPPGLHRDPKGLGQLIQSAGVTTLHFVPAMLQAFLEDPAGGPSCQRVRQVMCSGEALPRELERRFFQQVPDAQLHNLYGPTEAAVDVTAWTCRRDDVRSSVPIGRPIANARIHILDGSRQPVPIGVAGELYIGGTPVGRGYWQRAQLTAEKFVPDLYSVEPGARMYRTGDLARYLDDGNIEYLGRIDNQVKLRGYRIELGEVEAVLSQVDGVRESVVTVREDVPGLKRLVAYVVGRLPELAVLREGMQAKLPEYMVPSAFVLLDKLPLTGSGKIDRKALPAPEAPTSSSEKYVEPQSPAEKILANIWAKVLGVNRVSVSDRFFELGGDSIVVIRVVAKAAEEGLLVTPSQMFAHQTLGALAAVARTTTVAAHDRSSLAPFALLPADSKAIDRSGSIEDAYPLTPLQQGVVFHTMSAGSKEMYLAQSVLELKGELAPALLQKAWQWAVARHAILRTSFIWEGVERPVQRVHREVEIPWAIRDLRGMEGAAQRTTVDGYLAEDRRRGFDLAAPPLIRLALFRMAENVHQLVWSQHLILLDGWSAAALRGEVFAAYEAFARGGKPTVVPPRPYRDFVEWLTNQDLESAKAFWKQRLGSFVTPTLLGQKRAAAPGEEGEGGELEVRLSAETTAALQSLAKRRNLTLNTLIQGSWALLLSRHTGQEDVAFGVTVAGRPAELVGVESMVGSFINTLPLRVKVSDGDSVSAWLEQLQSRQLELQQFSYTPLVTAQGTSAIESGSPLFDSILVFENYWVEDRSEPNRRLDVQWMRAFERVNYPLTVVVIPKAELAIQFHYDSACFAAEKVALIAGHLSRILQSLSGNQDGRVGALELLTEPEKRKLLVEWNDTRLDYPHTQCIHDLFEEQSRSTPDAVAVTFEGNQLSYLALNEKANQLAHALRKRGIGPEVLVALCVERSLEMVVGMLGILKAGGAYVPLDPGYPQERLKHMLEDSKARVLVTNSSLSNRGWQKSDNVLFLDRDWPAIASEPSHGVPSGATPRNIAYLIYTSGSTGRPKGVMVSHGELVSSTAARKQCYGRTGRFLVLSSIAFDSSVAGIFGSLCSGGEIILPTDSAARDASEIAALITSCAVQTTLAIPSLLEVVLAGEARGAPSLETIIVAGEACSSSAIAVFAAKAPQARVFNEYGPTEATVWSTVFRVTPAERRPTIPIGKAIGNARLYLLDPKRRPVPVGTLGELYVGGAGVARGYLGRPDLTAERFLPDPFSTDAGARMYRTGDLARHLPDGDLEFVGRVDQQVKVRGFRIELAEIETVLGGFRNVREAVVVVRGETTLDQRLVAYLTVNGERPDVAELRLYAAKTLPEYSIPAAFMVVDAMPLTPNGKIDRKSLPDPDSSSVAFAVYVPPRNPIEEALARIWAQVLGLEKVGMSDRFFELGGDSILSIRVVSKAAEAGIRITPTQLFKHPTIGQLAAVATPVTKELEQELDDGEMPLTPIQSWFFERSYLAMHHWNQPMIVKVRRPISPEVLEQGLMELSKHHDALRLRFVAQDDGGWRQVLTPKLNVAFSRVDLRGESEADRPKVLERLASEAQATLDLADGPILRGMLFDWSDDEPARLVIIIHHLAVDGVSWRLLLEDLDRVCQQIERHETIRLPPKTTSFKWWARRLEEYASTPEATRELPFWSSCVAERRKASALPVDFHDGSNSVEFAREVKVSLNVEETAALLRDVPPVYHTEVNDVLLTALVQAFGVSTGRWSLWLELEGHGRQDEIVEGANLARTVGWFTSQYPVHLRLAPGDQAGDALKSVKEQLRRIPKRGVGYGILRHLGDESTRRELAHPTPEVSFNYLGQFDEIYAPSSLWGTAREAIGPSRAPGQAREHLIDVLGAVVEKKLEFSWSYGEQIHSRQTIIDLAQRYVEALRAIIAHCTSSDAGGFTPSDFPLLQLDADQMAQILEDDP